jgi:GNAT superfamily N-acetyltransferase
MAASFLSFEFAGVWYLVTRRDQRLKCIAPAEGNVWMPEILREASREALFEAIQENEVAFWLNRARLAGWEVHEEPGLTWYRSGLRSPMFNGVIQTTLSDDEADARIEAILARFRTDRLPMVWWSGPSRRPLDLGARLLARGLTTPGDDPGMAADLQALNEDVATPAGLTIELVANDAALRTWMLTLRATDGLPPPTREPDLALQRPASFATEDDYRLYLARLDGAPVGTAAAQIGDGVVGLYCVGVVQEARRQGIGAAVTLAALREAHGQGYRFGVLGASEMGESVYRRLGFKRYGFLQMFKLLPDDRERSI